MNGTGYTRYGPEICCTVGTAVLAASSPTAVQYDKLLLTLVFHRETGEILAAQSNLVPTIAGEFVEDIFVGRNLYTQVDEMADMIRRRYGGAGHKALTACLRDAYRKMNDRR